MRENKKTNFVAALVPAFALAVAMGMVAGCGDIKIDTSQLGGGDKSKAVDLSKAGMTPNPSWHPSYLEGAHGGFGCGDCHTSAARTARTADGKSPFREIAGNQICSQCHMDAYNRTTYFNHQSTKANTYCNSCHYSNSFRSRTRISHSQYHYAVTGSCNVCHTGKTPSSHANGRTSNCQSCHKYPSWSPSGGSHSSTSNCVSCHAGKTPGNHKADGRTGGCEKCHSYPDWRNASFNHSGVSSGCANCHGGHYGGFACEACHTSGISWSYRHSRVRGDACSACHNGDGHGGGGGDGDDD